MNHDDCLIVMMNRDKNEKKFKSCSSEDMIVTIVGFMSIRVYLSNIIEI